MPAISATPATDLSPNYLSNQPEGFWRDRGALDRSWNPPVLVGREEVLAQLETAVLPGLTSGRGVAVSIRGPRGSGSSATAAHLVATANDRMARPGSNSDSSRGRVLPHNLLLSSSSRSGRFCGGAPLVLLTPDKIG